MKNLEIKMGSVFTGIGGIELGFQRQGFQTAWFVEKEVFCRRLLGKNFPAIPIYEDVKNFNAMLLRVGFRARTFQMLDRELAIAGEQSSLKEQFQTIRLVRPKFATVENVSALCYRGLDTVPGDLGSIGYDAEWDCLRASQFGAPHRRERIFVAAHAVGLGLSRPWLHQASVNPAPDAYREAADVVDAFRRKALPFVCRRHHGLSTELDEARLKALGNAVVPLCAEFVASQIRRIWPDIADLGCSESCSGSGRLLRWHAQESPK